jgi:hypothetical protein
MPSFNEMLAAKAAKEGARPLPVIDLASAKNVDKKNVWQNPSIRAEYLIGKYQTDEIIRFAKLIANGKRTPLSSQDCIVCIQLANIFQLRDGIERERLYDRTFGKVPDRSISLNLNIDATPEQLSERALALLDKIAPPPLPIDDATDDDSDLVDE